MEKWNQSGRFWVKNLGKAGDEQGQKETLENMQTNAVEIQM